MKTFHPVSAGDYIRCEHEMSMNGRALVRAHTAPPAWVVVRVPVERRRRDVWPLVVSLVVVMAIWGGLGAGLAYLMTR